MFVTHHTEYHLRADECVGVRDLETGAWLRHHAALRMQAVSFSPGDEGEPSWVGRRLQFLGHGNDVLTSPVVDVDRPPLASVEHYVSQARAGTLHAP